MKNIVLLAAGLTLVACGPRLPATEPDRTTLTLSGTVQEGRLRADASGLPELRRTTWSQGTRPLVALIPDNTGGAEVARGSIAANGAFTITLPPISASALQELNLNEDEFCTVTVTERTPGMRGTGIFLMAQFPGTGVNVAPMEFSFAVNATGTQATARLRTESYVYVDRPGVLRARQVCNYAGVQTVDEVDAQLHRGWNRLTQTVTATENASGESTLTVRTDNSTLAAGWLAQFDDFMPLASNDAVQAMGLFGHIHPLFR